MCNCNAIRIDVYCVCWFFSLCLVHFSPIMYQCPTWTVDGGLNTRALLYTLYIHVPASSSSNYLRISLVPILPTYVAMPTPKNYTRYLPLEDRVLIDTRTVSPRVYSSR